MFRTLLPAALLAIALSGLSACQGPAASPVPRMSAGATTATGGKLLAFAGATDLFSGPTAIYVLDPVSGSLQQLSAADRNCSRPIWSPDGARVAFMCAPRSPGLGSALCAADLGGAYSCSDELPYHDLRGWHPDGKRLVSVTVEDSKARVELLSPDGWATEPFSGMENAMSPTWSSGGQFMVLHTPDAVWMANGDGSDRHALADSLAGQYVLPSPDGRQIAAVVVDALADRLYVGGVPGRTLRPIGEVYTETAPVWSSDSSQLAYVGLRGLAPALYVADAATGNSHFIDLLAPGDWSGEYRPAEPSWLGGGALLAYSTLLHDGMAYIFITRPNHTELRRLSTGRQHFALIFDLAWQP